MFCFYVYVYKRSSRVFILRCFFLQDFFAVAMRPLAVAPYLQPALLLAIAAATVSVVRAGHSVHDPIEYYVSVYNLLLLRSAFIIIFILLSRSATVTASAAAATTSAIVAPHCFCTAAPPPIITFCVILNTRTRVYSNSIAVCMVDR